MKNKEYRSYSFRLDDRTYEKLKKLRREKDLSWNKLFLELLKELNTKN